MAAASEISPAQAARLMDALTAIVARASTLIGGFTGDRVDHKVKADQSPVTAADEASEAAILEGLARVLPGVPVISEEMAGREKPPAIDGSFLLVDPLDGTREFIAGRDEFTVNLAIITHGVPIAGIIAAPKRGLVWRGILGSGAERLRLTADGADQPQAIHTRRWPQRDGVAVVSRSHLDPATEAFLAKLGPLTRNGSGSAIKFCQVAEASADIYPRLATTCEWDLAAGHALVTAAGGAVTNPQGGPFVYGNAAVNFRVPAFIAWGDPDKAKSVGA